MEMSFFMNCWEKCEKPVPGTHRLPKNKNGHYNDFAELEIAIENDEIVIKRYENKSLYNLPVDEGVFEGVDIGEWGGIVRFRPYKPENYLSVQRPCHFCGSTAENCCAIDIAARNPYERNVLEGIDGVDFVKFKGVGIYIYAPRGDPSIFSVIDENCFGLFKIGNRNFAITGLTCITEEYGKIYELIVTHNDVVANKIIDVGDYVESFISVEELKTAYIATRTSLFAFKDDKLTKLLDFHCNLNPGSIICLDGYLYIGMRRGYMCKYRIETEESEWYRYTGESFLKE